MDRHPVCRQPACSAGKANEVPLERSRRDASIAVIAGLTREAEPRHGHLVPPGRARALDLRTDPYLVKPDSYGRCSPKPFQRYLVRLDRSDTAAEALDRPCSDQGERGTAGKVSPRRVHSSRVCQSNPKAEPRHGHLVPPGRALALDRRSDPYLVKLDGYGRGSPRPFQRYLFRLNHSDTAAEALEANEVPLERSRRDASIAVAFASPTREAEPRNGHLVPPGRARALDRRSDPYLVKPDSYGRGSPRPFQRYLVRLDRSDTAAEALDRPCSDQGERGTAGKVSSRRVQSSRVCRSNPGSRASARPFIPARTGSSPGPADGPVPGQTRQLWTGLVEFFPSISGSTRSDGGLANGELSKFSPGSPHRRAKDTVNSPCFCLPLDVLPRRDRPAGPYLSRPCSDRNETDTGTRGLSRPFQRYVGRLCKSREASGTASLTSRTAASRASFASQTTYHLPRAESAARPLARLLSRLPACLPASRARGHGGAKVLALARLGTSSPRGRQAGRQTRREARAPCAWRMPGLRPRVAPGRPRRSRYRWKLLVLARSLCCRGSRQAGRLAESPASAQKCRKKVKVEVADPQPSCHSIPMWGRPLEARGRRARTRSQASAGLLASRQAHRQAGRLGGRASRGGRLPASCGTVVKLLVLAGSPYRAGRQAGSGPVVLICLKAFAGRTVRSLAGNEDWKSFDHGKRTFNLSLAAIHSDYRSRNVFCWYNPG
ncbi:hypothetical protein MAR_035435 [Mya arenaria]|uniref:Uncharacterized protein n=1 Tax=Mya arenaria TaxID=6604 RepID=A0ABY7EN06_MYAAR|nr:hypothetical protein MAR_035435 [Mya arenaria]